MSQEQERARSGGGWRFLRYARNLAVHPRAESAMVTLSFCESLFLPGPPPDVALAPMTLARPRSWLRLATLCTLASVAGGICGWALGFWGGSYAERLIIFLDMTEHFEHIKEWFNIWGVWVVLVAGFSPLPYKVFTIGSGLLALSLPMFVFGSLLGRGMRFFLVAALMRFVGAPLLPALERRMVALGWACALFFIIFLIFISII